MSHRIRLGPPWESNPIANGWVRHVRRFGRPRTLDPDERLTLALELPTDATATVNGTPWLPGEDLRDRLLPRNELVIEAPSAFAPENVALEIHGAQV